MQLSKSIACAAVLTVLSAVGMAQSQQNPWAKSNPGSWVKLKSTTEMALAGQKNVISTEVKMTLLSKTATEASVETEATMMGRASKTTVKIPLNSGYTGTAKPVAPPKIGSETITVAGKTFKCITVEFQTEANGMKMNMKSWIADSVPGGLVKSESTTTGAANTKTVMELVDFKAA